MIPSSQTLDSHPSLSLLVPFPPPYNPQAGPHALTIFRNFIPSYCFLLLCTKVFLSSCYVCVSLSSHFSLFNGCFLCNIISFATHVGDQVSACPSLSCRGCLKTESVNRRSLFLTPFVSFLFLLKDLFIFYWNVRFKKI